MSAAATAQFARPGWPALNPAGWSKFYHSMNLRGARVTASATEEKCCQLILGATLGMQKEWELIDVGWFAHHTDRCPRMVSKGLEAAENHGFITRQRAGKFNRYRINTDRFKSAPEVERLEPELVESLPIEPVPRTRLIQTQERVRSYDGDPMPKYAEGRLLVAEEEGTTTVAECGNCKKTGIYRMVPASELQLGTEGEEKAKEGEEKAKDEIEFRFKSLKTQSHDKSGPEELPEEQPDKKPKFTDPQQQAVYEYLCKWRPAFDRLPYDKETVRVAKALGAAPIDYLDALLRRKGFPWFRANARHFGAFLPFARDALSAYVFDAGEICPGCQEQGREQRLKPGDICAHCFAPEPQPTKPEHEDGDWGPVKAELHKSVPHLQYCTWVEPTWIDSVSGDSMQVRVPDSQTRNCLSGVYSEHVKNALKAAHGDRYSRVDYVVEVQRE